MNIKDLKFKLTVLSTGQIHRFKFTDLKADDYGLWLNINLFEHIHVYGNAACYSWEENDYINPDILIELDI